MKDLKTLSELRSQKNLTQRGLAKILKVIPSTIAMYEIGERNPSLERAKNIAKFFNVPVETISFQNKFFIRKGKYNE